MHIPNPRITFGMIVLNGQPFIKYSLRALYPFAHQIIVVEGAAPAAKSIATPDGHSLDGTLDALRRFKVEEDVDCKVVVVTAEDGGHPDGFWSEKDEMSQAYAARATGNYLWQIDNDEFYLPEDMQAVVDMLAREPAITAVTFPLYTFWGGLAYRVNGLFLARDAFHRLFAWGPGYRYTTHRPPTVVDDRGRDVRSLRWITGPQMKRKGVFLYHYELLFPKQVVEKCRYYARVGWTSELRQADAWASNCYLTLTRPFRVHMLDRHLSWLERFAGPHPPEVERMMAAVTSGHEGVAPRRVDDVEALLADPGYRMKRALLKMAVPVETGRVALKAAARRLLKDSVVWRLLQTANRRAKGES